MKTPFFPAAWNGDSMRRISRREMVPLKPLVKRSLDAVLLTADYLGTLLFAMEGALAGIRGGLDLFGILVLAFITAVGGGILRDLLIGAVPPASIRNWRYGAIAF